MNDSMHSSKTWPCDYVKDILSRFLNMLQCSAGLVLKIADWKNVEMCFAKDIPQQQPGDTWNCGIFVLLMMELIAKNEDMCFDKFPFSLQDMHLVRRRLILNIKKFNIPRILYHEPSGGKDDSYKASSSLAPGSVKDVHQSLSSALSAGIKPPVAGGTDSVPGYGRGGDSDSRSSGPGSRSGEKYSLAPQRSPGPALISKPDLGYNSQSSNPYQSSGGQSSGAQSRGKPYERWSSSSYSSTNGLSINYGVGSSSSSSYNNASQAGSCYPSTNSGFNSSQQGRVYPVNPFYYPVYFQVYYPGQHPGIPVLPHDQNKDSGGQLHIHISVIKPFLPLFSNNCYLQRGVITAVTGPLTLT